MGRRTKRRCGWTRAHVVVFLVLIGGSLVAAPSLLRHGRRFFRREADVAAEAKDYLRERNVKPLDVDLDALLAESRSASLPTLPHPLLSQVAPDFQLRDHTGQLQKLRDHLAKGPVVVVFYYGYYCNHCVGQLFALNDDMAKFRELGAEVVAISADSPEDTREKFSKYGTFAFPVLSDPGNKVASQYSVYSPRTATVPERLLHGTFIVDREGIVRWCHYDHAPFTANATLLVELAKAQGRLSETEPASDAAGSQGDAVPVAN